MVRATARKDEVTHESDTAAEPGPRLVVIESPYAGDVRLNEAYARACMADALQRGEIPYASHLLFTQAGILDDDCPEERARGIEAGFAWASATGAACVVYTDLGTSQGMRQGIARAEADGRPVEYRTLAPGDVAMVRHGAEDAHAAELRMVADAERARRLVPEGVKCTGCGSHWTDERLREEKAKRPNLISCCPERKVVPVYRDARGYGPEGTANDA